MGGTETCTATVQGTGSFSTTVNWTASAGSITSAGVFTAPNAAGPVTITATSTADATKSGTATVTVLEHQSSGFTYRGVTLTGWSTGEYLGAQAAEDALAATGVTWAGVLTTQYMANRNSNTIAPVAGQTPSDSDVIAAITAFHARGVKVMLKPHVDVSDGTWRGQIGPTDVNAWFANYTTFITHYAQLAQSNAVEMLCIGTEFATMTGAANKTAWDNVIAAIRAPGPSGGGYTGLTTYAANATSAGDEFTSVSFWDNPQLDIIGLDGYFPLTDHADPTLGQLVNAWSMNRNGMNIVAAVTNFASAHPGKPVMFTEIGYRSMAGANIAPWDFNTASPADQTEQQNCYQAMYTVWSQHSDQVKGVFWWSWRTFAPQTGDTDYTPQLKQAQGVLEAWQ